MLVNPDDTWAETQITNMEAAARTVGQQLIVLRANTRPDIDAAFATVVKKRDQCAACRRQSLFVTQAD